MIDFERILHLLDDEGVECVIVGGVAATIHGSARLTADLDIVYGRSKENIRRLVKAIAPLKPYMRGAPPGLPFHFDEPTVRAGLNFTLTTNAGPLDVRGEIGGGFTWEVLRRRSSLFTLYGRRFRVIDIDALIENKIAVGRAKDLEVVAELEVIREETSG